MQVLDEGALPVVDRRRRIENGRPPILVVMAANLNRGEIARGVPFHGVDRDRSGLWRRGVLFDKYLFLSRRGDPVDGGDGAVIGLGVGIIHRLVFWRRRLIECGSPLEILRTDILEPVGRPFGEWIQINLSAGRVEKIDEEEAFGRSIGRADL